MDIKTKLKFIAGIKTEIHKAPLQARQTSLTVLT